MLELIFLETFCFGLPGLFREAPPPSTLKRLARLRFCIIFWIFIFTILWLVVTFTSFQLICHWLSIFWTLSEFKLSTLCDSLSNSESQRSVCEAYWLKTSSLDLIFFLFLSHYSQLVFFYPFWVLVSLEIGLSSLGIYTVPSLGICFLSLEM